MAERHGPRRCRDLIELHTVNLGGEASLSEAENSIVRRASVLETELERMEANFAVAGAADMDTLDCYQRVSGGLRRLLETIGLERRSRDVTPSLEAYLASKSREASVA
jgi:hypothetical protein